MEKQSSGESHFSYFTKSSDVLGCLLFCFLEGIMANVNVVFLGSVLVNPPSHIRIKNKTLGFLIAEDAADAHRYCFLSVCDCVCMLCECEHGC